MPFDTPTRADVDRAFREAVRSAHEFNADVYDALLAGMERPDWQPTSEGVETLAVPDRPNVKLVRVSWAVRVDGVDPAARHKLDTAAAALRRAIGAAHGSGPAGFGRHTLTVDRKGAVTAYTGTAQGVAGDPAAVNPVLAVTQAPV